MLNAKISTVLDVKMRHFIIVKVAAGSHACALTLLHLTVVLDVNVRMGSAGKVTSVFHVNARDLHFHKFYEI